MVFQIFLFENLTFSALQESFFFKFFGLFCFVPFQTEKNQKKLIIHSFNHFSIKIKIIYTPSEDLDNFP